MTLDVPVSYADIAGTLPLDIVESIETSMPCLKSANRQHLWDQFWIHSWGTAEPSERFWGCVYCGARTHTAPVPPVEHPWPSI